MRIQRPREVWVATLAGSGVLVASVALFALTGPVTVLPEDIAGEREVGAGDAVLGLAALALAVAVPFVLARVSRRGRWAVTGVVAAAAGLAAMALLGNLLPGLLGAVTTLLALGLGVVGAVALPQAEPAVVAWRGVAVVAVVALSVLLVRAEALDPTPLLVLPALALADTLANAGRVT